MQLVRRLFGPRSPQTRARLTLEALDLRLSPSTLFDPITGVPIPDSGGPGTDPGNPVLIAPIAPPANSAPRVINFAGVEVVGGLWRFSGDVIDEAPGGLTVTLGGEPASLQGKAIVTDANGHFDKAFLLNTDGSDNGLTEAQTVDAGGLQSNVALTIIRPG